MSWLKPRPTKILEQRQNQLQRLPGSMNLNRPLQNQKQSQRRPPKKQKQAAATKSTATSKTPSPTCGCGTGWALQHPLLRAGGTPALPTSKAPSPQRREGRFLHRVSRRKQIPLCVPRPPNCGGKEKARDSVRDDTRLSPSINRRSRLFRITPSQVVF